jgi:hypothetical protein
MGLRNFGTSIHRFKQRRFLIIPEGRLWVVSPFRSHKTFPRFRPNYLFECSECRKCVLMAFRHHETSFHRHQQSRIFRRPHGRFSVTRPIRVLKISLKQLHSSRFIRCSGCREWVHMAFRHLEKSLHPLHQSRFLRRPQRSLRSQNHSPP